MTVVTYIYIVIYRKRVNTYKEKQQVKNEIQREREKGANRLTADRKRLHRRIENTYT